MGPQKFLGMVCHSLRVAVFDHKNVYSLDGLGLLCQICYSRSSGMGTCKGVPEKC